MYNVGVLPAFQFVSQVGSKMTSKVVRGTEKMQYVENSNVMLIHFKQDVMHDRGNKFFVIIYLANVIWFMLKLVQ